MKRRCAESLALAPSIRGRGHGRVRAHFHESEYERHSTGAHIHGAELRGADVGIVGTAGRPGVKPIAAGRKIAIDLEGDALAGLGRDSGVALQADVSHGTILATAAYPIVGQRNRWRAMVDVAPAAPGPADLRLYLRHGDRALSETIIVPVF